MLLLRSRGMSSQLQVTWCTWEVKERSEHVVDLAGARSQSRAFSNGMSPKELVGRKWFQILFAQKGSSSVVLLQETYPRNQTYLILLS